MGIKTIIFDIDETLVNNEVFPPNNDLIIKHILNLKMHNYSFGICTSRPLDDFVKKIVKTYLIDNYIICEGGAIVYKKNNNTYIKVKKYVKNDINKFIIKKISEIVPINMYIYNKNRIVTSTIRMNNNNNNIDLLSYLYNFYELKDFNVDNNNNNKIFIYHKKIDKIYTINDIYKVGKVIFVTDYEKKISNPNKNIQVYSVGTDSNFNKKCHKTFSKSSVGVLEILKEEESKYERI